MIKIKIINQLFSKIAKMYFFSQCVKSNLNNRSEDLDDEPDAFDGQMLWLLLRRIRHSERLRVKIKK